VIILKNILQISSRSSRSKAYNRPMCVTWRSQWPRGLRCGSSVARLLDLWVRIPLGAWTFVCYECCVLSGRGFCDELITRTEESYWLWCVVVCDLETPRIWRPWPALGRSATGRSGCVILSDFNFLQSIITIWRMFGFGVGVTSD
jgi:hypothetical protein